MKTKHVVAKDVPERMHRTFKTICTQHGVSMTEAIMMYMRKVEASAGSIIEEWRGQEAELGLDEEQTG